MTYPYLACTGKSPIRYAKVGTTRRLALNESSVLANKCAAGTHPSQLMICVTRAEFKSQNQNKYQYEACHARYKNYDNYKLKPPSEQLTPGPLICYKRSNNLANTLVHARLRATKKPPRELYMILTLKSQQV